MPDHMLRVYGPYEGDRTESRSYFFDSQCVGTSYSRDGKHYYRPTRSAERPVFESLGDLMAHAKAAAKGEHQMPKTLTDEQWDVVRDAADEMAEILDYDTCNDPECRHLDCRRNRPQADAIRQVIAAVEKEG